MELIKDIKHIKEPFKNPVITIGNFDGVHKGHQSLIRSVISKAAELGGTSVAMTFEPHPAKVLAEHNPLPLITLLDQKIELIEKTGIDVLICVPFTPEFAAVTAAEFVEDILTHRIGMKAIVIGKDYSFGRNRQGNVALLQKYAGDLGFEVIISDWEQVSDKTAERISSTRIREIITAGEVEKAPDMLGRYYQIRGKVVTGRNRGGKLLGFPTANIHLYDELSPKTGVYAVTVKFGGHTYPGVANIGYSPTFGDHLFTVEIHILDFNKDIYGETIRVNFISRLREEKKFSNISELSEQIRRDIVKARTILPK